MIRTWKLQLSILCLSVFSAAGVQAQSGDQSFFNELDAAAEVEGEQAESDEDATALLIQELASADGWETTAKPVCWIEYRCTKQFSGLCGDGFRRVTKEFRCCGTASGGKSCKRPLIYCGHHPLFCAR